MIDRTSLRQRGLISTGYHIPYNPKLKDRARELRRNMTVAEKRLWICFLRNVKHNMLRQKPLDNYIVDFYCPKLKLVIEVDGESHCTNEGKEYDEVRTQILEGYGLKVVRVKNEEVTNEFESVCEKLRKEFRR